MEWLVEILPFTALTDGEKAKIFEGAASTPELGKMQLFHDAAGRAEYPHFSGRRVRLIVGLGRCEGSEPTGTSLGETQSTLSTTHDETCELVEEIGICGNLLSGVIHAYIPLKFKEEGIPQTTANDGQSLARDVVANARQPRSWASGGRRVPIRNKQHPMAPKVGQAHLMNRRGHAYGDHLGTISMARKGAQDRRLVAGAGRIRTVSLPFQDLRNGGGVPVVADVHMAMKGHRRGTVVQLAGKPVFAAADATGRRVAMLIRSRLGKIGEHSSSDEESSKDGEDGEDGEEQGVFESAVVAGADMADMVDGEDGEQQGGPKTIEQTQRSALLICVNGAGRAEMALLLATLNAHNVATISIDAAQEVWVVIGSRGRSRSRSSRVVWGGEGWGGGVVWVRGDRQEIEILLWDLVVALACCLYAPELDIQ